MEIQLGLVVVVVSCFGIAFCVIWGSKNASDKKVSKDAKAISLAELSCLWSQDETMQKKSFVNKPIQAFYEKYVFQQIKDKEYLVCIEILQRLDREGFILPPGESFYHGEGSWGLLEKPALGQLCIDTAMNTPKDNAGVIIAALSKNIGRLASLKAAFNTEYYRKASVFWLASLYGFYDLDGKKDILSALKKKQPDSESNLWETIQTASKLLKQKQIEENFPAAVLQKPYFWIDLQEFIKRLGTFINKAVKGKVPVFSMPDGHVYFPLQVIEKNLLVKQSNNTALSKPQADEFFSALIKTLKTKGIIDADLLPEDAFENTFIVLWNKNELKKKYVPFYAKIFGNLEELEKQKPTSIKHLESVTPRKE